MSSQYLADQQDAYNDLKQDGGPIKILRPQSNHVDNTEASSDIVDDSFWQGTNDKPIETQTFGLLVPGGSSIIPFDQILISGHNLDFDIVNGMLIQDVSGKVYQITQTSRLSPDGLVVILYTCNIEHKPDYSFDV